MWRSTMLNRSPIFAPRLHWQACLIWCSLLPGDLIVPLLLPCTQTRTFPEHFDTTVCIYSRLGFPSCSSPPLLTRFLTTVQKKVFSIPIGIPSSIRVISFDLSLLFRFDSLFVIESCQIRAGRETLPVYIGLGRNRLILFFRTVDR